MVQHSKRTTRTSEEIEEVLDLCAAGAADDRLTPEQRATLDGIEAAIEWMLDDELVFPIDEAIMEVISNAAG